MMDFSKEELEKLADGLSPEYVRRGLECETVIVELARFALALAPLIEIRDRITKINEFIKNYESEE